MKITLCGNLGQRTGQLDGQTYKTRLVHGQLIKRLGLENVRLIDTSYMVRHPFAVWHSLKRGYASCDALIAMPGSNGLSIFSYFLDRWRKQHRKAIHYIVVGGWLPELVERRARIRSFCAAIEGVHVETPSMVQKLRKVGLTNVHLMPNFREFDGIPLQGALPGVKELLPLRACYYSRVTKTKGVELAMEACRRVNQAGKTKMVTLDIFGPVSKDFQRQFKQLQEQYPEHEYKGVLPPEDPFRTLRNYDVMLFPTYYSGEGFPGAVLDAFIAGIPVIASDWRYNNEIIESGRTGLLFKARQTGELERRILELAANPELLSSMKRNVIVELTKYHADTVFPELFRRMGLRSDGNVLAVG